MERGSWYETCMAMARYCEFAYLPKERDALNLYPVGGALGRGR